MNDKQAANLLKWSMFSTTCAKGSGKSGLLIRRYQAKATGRAVAALERGVARPVTVKGSIFKRWYCPACHERVKKGGLYCHACGQRYGERILFESLVAPDPIKPLHHGGYSPRVVILDEMHEYRGK